VLSQARATSSWSGS